MITRIKVVVEEDLPGLAGSRGYLWWKHLVLHPSFGALAPAEQLAVLYHEIGHYVMWHNEIRWLAFLFGWGLGYDWLVRCQEDAADAFAAAHGHGRALAAVLERRNTYIRSPAIAARIAKLSA